MSKPLYIARHLGFCVGVRHAIELFEALTASREEPCYVLHEVVHNNIVTAKMVERGAVVVQKLEEIPQGSLALFGAHGVSTEILELARKRGLRITDACCPFVRKLQKLASELVEEQELVLFGRLGHPEVEGIIGHSGTRKNHVISSLEELSALPDLVAPLLLVQTTANQHEAEKIRQAFLERFPQGRAPVQVCNASQERQDAVRELAEYAAGVLVLGSAHSSNANRLKETAEQKGARACLVETADDIPEEFLHLPSLGITAGASTPDFLIDQTIQYLEKYGFLRQNI